VHRYGLREGLQGLYPPAAIRREATRPLHEGRWTRIEDATDAVLRGKMDSPCLKHSFGELEAASVPRCPTLLEDGRSPGRREGKVNPAAGATTRAKRRGMCVERIISALVSGDSTALYQCSAVRRSLSPRIDPSAIKLEAKEAPMTSSPKVVWATKSTPADAPRESQAEDRGSGRDAALGPSLRRDVVAGPCLTQPPACSYCRAPGACGPRTAAGARSISCCAACASADGCRGRHVVRKCVVGHASPCCASAPICNPWGWYSLRRSCAAATPCARASRRREPGGGAPAAGEGRDDVLQAPSAGSANERAGGGNRSGNSNLQARGARGHPPACRALAARQAPRDLTPGQDALDGLGRREEAVAPEGHGSCAPWVDPLSHLEGRRQGPRPCRALVRLQAAEEGAAPRAALRARRALPGGDVLHHRVRENPGL